mgnify:CR=1 FL=1
MKILRTYAVTAIICISLTAIIACIFIADENAKRITLGNESSVAVINSSAEKLEENGVCAASDFIAEAMLTWTVAGESFERLNGVLKRIF